MSAQPKIIIIVEGGLVNEIIANQYCKVTILDYDTEGGNPERVMKWTNENGEVRETYVIEEEVNVNANFIQRVSKEIEIANTFTDAVEELRTTSENLGRWREEDGEEERRQREVELKEAKDALLKFKVQ